MSAETIKCKRCGNMRPPLGYAPLPTALGQKVGAEVCQPCWAEWLQKQNQLINHFGLDLSNPEAHDFLFENMKIFFYNEGSDLAQIDTSKEGSVKW
jgi:Fe-S cluster biosynthesis and repair protein YggX